MKIYLELMMLLFASWYEYVGAQQTILDAFVPQLRIGKDLLLKILTPTAQNSRNLRVAEGLQKLQPRISDDSPFPCVLNNTRSKKRPKSVHALRPGDIDVVGAIGDSLTAGNGLTATNIFHIALENRGISFAIGGQGTWKEFVTLPNILKEFNPHLIGYSLQDSFGHHTAAQFNAAEAGAISNEMPYMTKVLIKRMKSDPRVNIAKHWKMVTFMIGPNDFCGEMCYRENPETIIEDHRKDLITVLRTLRDNLPRTIVNLVVTPSLIFSSLVLLPDLKVLVNTTLINRPSHCYFSHNIICPCLFGLQFQHLKTKFVEIMTKWQLAQMEVAKAPEFDREDFTVVVQPFTVNYNLRTSKNGLTDYSVLSQDCFHLSQKEGARAALSLWNNIVEPVGTKSTQPSDLFNFKCPGYDHPFIYTRRNS